MDKQFGSFDEVLTHVRQQAHIAAEHAEDWQLAVQPGSYVVINDGDCLIYSEILPMPEDTWPKPSRFWRFSKGHSAFDPSGELGSVHVGAFGGLLTKAQFEQARRLGWPRTLQELKPIVAGDPRWSKLR